MLYISFVFFHSYSRFFRKQKLIICFYSVCVWCVYVWLFVFQPMFFLLLYIWQSVFWSCMDLLMGKKQFFGSLSCCWVYDVYMLPICSIFLIICLCGCWCWWWCVCFFGSANSTKPKYALWLYTVSFHETSLNGQTDLVVYEYSKEVKDKRASKCVVKYRNSNGDYMNWKWHRIRRIVFVRSNRRSYGQFIMTVAWQMIIKTPYRDLFRPIQR